MNILKVDCLWTTNMVQIRLFKKMAADKKNSIHWCISVDFHSFKPVYMLQMFTFISIFIYYEVMILIK